MGNHSGNRQNWRGCPAARSTACSIIAAPSTQPPPLWSMIIAKKLDYKPNRAGIALAAQRKMVRIGVVLFDTGNPFFDEVWNSVLSKEEELNSYNCSVLKKKTGFSAQEQLQLSPSWKPKVSMDS